MREYLRPNLFANTPDILHEYLQQRRPAGVPGRACVLAATLGASYGIYSGFELCENRAVPGSEEYLDSEKYEVRPRDWDRPGNIKELIARVNQIRREQPGAARATAALRFHADRQRRRSSATRKTRAGADATASCVVVNLDPFATRRTGWVSRADLADIGPGRDATCTRCTTC